MGALGTTDGTREGPCLEGAAVEYKPKSVFGVGLRDGLAMVGTAVVGASVEPSHSVGLAVSA